LLGGEDDVAIGGAAADLTAIGRKVGDVPPFEHSALGEELAHSETALTTGTGKNHAIGHYR